LAQAVRRQLALGRLLPLGGPKDGTWLAERAADVVLRESAAALPGIRLGPLRLALSPSATSATPAVPPPPSALPPAPLLLTAEFAATATEPFPTAAARLRSCLAEAAEDRLGLVLDAVDLRVTGMLDAFEPVDTGPPPESHESPAAAVGSEASSAEARAATAAAGVRGVARLTGALSGVGRAVHVEEQAGSGDAALPAVHVRVELAVRAGHRALDVALAVRHAVAESFTDGTPGGRPSVAVLVTSVERQLLSYDDRAR
jgi:hypothetical protein